MKIAKGDNVLIIAGKDKGKTGSILRVLPNKNRVIVAGVNMRTKHIKKTAQQAGQKIRYEAAISVSNVMAIDPKTGKRTRIGYAIDEKTKKKIRVARKSGSPLAKTVAKPKPRQDVKKQDVLSKEPAKKDAPAKETKEKTTATGTPPAKAPFWKKLGFGADALGGSSDPTPGSTPGSDDASHPQAPGHARSGSRGS